MFRTLKSQIKEINLELIQYWLQDLTLDQDMCYEYENDHMLPTDQE